MGRFLLRGAGGADAEVRGAAAVIALGLITLGCASHVAIPRASKVETKAVEVELTGTSRDELEHGENLRFWEVFLTDPTVVAGFDETQRSLLSTTPIRDVAEAMHATFRERTGAQVLDLVRVSPAVLRELAIEAPPEPARSLYVVADAAETFQVVIHRRIEEVGRRVTTAAGRSDIQILPDASIGLNAAAPVRLDAREVYVGTELAVALATDDELACVIGHELAHITEGHTSAGAWAEVGKRVLAGVATGAAMVAIAYANQGQPLTQSQIDGAVSLGKLTRFALADVPLRVGGWERGQERGADAVGLYYAWKAGFSPDACPDMMTRIARHAHARGAEDGFWWWKSHPIHAERVVILRKLAASARAGTLEWHH